MGAMGARHLGIDVTAHIKVPGTWVLMFRLISKKVPGIGTGSDDSDDLCEWPVSHKRPRIVRIV